MCVHDIKLGSKNISKKRNFNWLQKNIFDSAYTSYACGYNYKHGEETLTIFRLDQAVIDAQW